MAAVAAKAQTMAVEAKEVVSEVQARAGN